jgi:competence protein ComGC
MSRMQMIKDVMEFIAARKKFWLLPLILVLLVVAVLLFVAEGSILSPFIYILF